MRRSQDTMKHFFDSYSKINNHTNNNDKLNSLIDIHLFPIDKQLDNEKLEIYYDVTDTNCQKI